MLVSCITGTACSRKEGEVLLTLCQSGAESALNGCHNIKVGAVQDGVLDSGGDLCFQTAVSNGVAGKLNLIGSLLVGHVCQICILDGVAEFRLFQTGDVGDPGDGAQRVDFERLNQKLSGKIGRQKLVAVAEISISSRDAAETFIGLAGNGLTGENSAVESSLCGNQILLRSHFAVGNSLGSNGFTLLDLHAVVLCLQRVIPLLEFITVSLLLFNVLHLGGRICGFLCEPVGICEDCGLDGGHLFFQFEQSHFRYSPFQKF